MVLDANVVLSENLDFYIDVHLKMKKGAMLFLLMNANFIVNKNKIDNFKYFTVSSRVYYNKKRKKNRNKQRRFSANDRDDWKPWVKVHLDNSSISKQRVVSEYGKFKPRINRRIGVISVVSEGNRITLD